MALIKSIKKYASRKNILTTIFFLILVALYFFLMYKIFKPNVLTWWSDEYEYVSQARNFALFSKLETSFYSAKAVLNGNFPSFGYHPILYSFLMGLFLKLFNAHPNATFTFNYLLTFLTLIIIYFYCKDRIKKKETIYPLILIALFPIVVIYANTQSPEIFFILLVSLTYYIFFKNNYRFNIVHFILLILLATVSCQRVIYLILSAVLLIFVYYNWLKNKKIIYFFSSIAFFVAFYYLLYWIFASNIQVYPAGEKMHVLQYIKYYGLSSLTAEDTWIFFYQHALSNIKNLFNIFINSSNNYFLFHWLFACVIFFNIFLTIKTKDKILKKELALILIPELILIIAGITFYVTTDLTHFTHLRPIFGFLPLNLFYLFLFMQRLNLKKRIIFLIIFIPLIIFSSFNVYKPFYLFKIESSNVNTRFNTNLLSETIKKIRYKENLVIAGDDSIDVRNYIVFNNNGDKFIRTNQFVLDEYELNEFVKKDYIDLWFVNDENHFIKEHLDNWPYSFNINGKEKTWTFFMKENSYPKELIYTTSPSSFRNEWKPLNQCKFIINKDEIVINSFGSDPYFENIFPISFKKGLNYYLKITLISPESSHFQIYFKRIGSDYNEQDSIRLSLYKGENTFINKIPDPQSIKNIRIDPGNIKGEYILKEISIYSSKY